MKARYWIVTLALAGCGTDDFWEVESFENEGTVCLHSADDGAAVVRVLFPTCLSSSCSRVVSSSCAVAVSGRELRLESSAKVAEKRGEGVACTADCGSLWATCESPPLEPGEYLLVYGDNTAELALPTGEASPIVGSMPCPPR